MPGQFFEDEERSGKWMLEAPMPRIKETFSLVDLLVEEGLVIGAKYSHKEERKRHSFSDAPPILMVYADDHDKRRVQYLLAGIGMVTDDWRYNAATVADWAQGGALAERERRWRKEHGIIARIKKAYASVRQWF